MEYPTVVNGVLFFRSTHTTDGTVSLWKTDGTEAGTVMIKAGPPQNLINVAGTLFFAGDDPTNGVELWKSDGTAAGTVLVKDINPGPNGSYPGSYPAQMAAVGNTLFFVADDGVHGQELWKSDGTAAGTIMVKDINATPGGSSGAANLTVVGTTLFFSADDGTNGVELWKTDGTPAGTVMVADINPGQNSSNPGSLTSFGGKLYFSADDGIHGNELWESDGTSAGSHLVADIAPAVGMGDSVGEMADFNGLLLFAGNDGTHGAELWISDGSATGIKCLRISTWDRIRRTLKASP